MTLLEINLIKAVRENLAGFLHHSDIAALNELFANDYDVNHKSFNEICDKAIELRKSKALKLKAATTIFNILKSCNSKYRVESHRFEHYNKIFEFDAGCGRYIFLKKGSRSEFYRLNHYL